MIELFKKLIEDHSLMAAVVSLIVGIFTIYTFAWNMAKSSSKEIIDTLKFKLNEKEKDLVKLQEQLHDNDNSVNTTKNTTIGSSESTSDVNKTNDSGNMNLSYVTSQGSIGSFISNKNNNEKITIAKLPYYLHEYLINNIDEKYFREKPLYHKHFLPSIERIEFIINATRISTFFCITDGSRILLFNRRNSENTVVENKKLDCFGSVTFENITLALKIDPNNESGFLNTTVKNIELLPGIAYEDNFDPEFGKQTVIMFGFIVTVSDEALDNLMTKENKDLKLIDIADKTRKQTAFTSKANLAKEYLKEAKLKGNS